MSKAIKRIPTAPPVSSGTRVRETDVARFQVLGRLGLGGSCNVFKVADTLNGGKICALKVIKDSPFESQISPREVAELEAGYLDEALYRTIGVPRLLETGQLIVNAATFNKASTELLHIPEIYGSTYILMEVVEGISLFDFGKELHKRKWPVTVNIMLACLHGILKGVSSLGPILHRDIKRGNIMLTKKGLVRLIDLGIAEDENARYESIHDLLSGNDVLGFCQNMAPENLGSTERGRGYQVKESDVFSAAMSVLLLCYGRSPYTVRNENGRLDDEKTLQKLASSFEVKAKDLYDLGIPDSDEYRPIVDLFLMMLKRNPVERGTVRYETAFDEEMFKIRVKEAIERKQGDSYASGVDQIISARANKLGISEEKKETELGQADVLTILEDQFGGRIANGYRQLKILVNAILEQKEHGQEILASGQAG